MTEQDQPRQHTNVNNAITSAQGINLHCYNERFLSYSYNKSRNSENILLFCYFHGTFLCVCEYRIHRHRLNVFFIFFFSKQFFFVAVDCYRGSAR